MERLSVRVEKSGRILIPAAIRRRLGIKDGETDIILEIDDKPPLRVTTRAQAIVRIQERLARYTQPGRLTSEELIQERRDEAAKEFAG